MEADDHLIFISAVIFIFSLIAFFSVLGNVVKYGDLVTGNAVDNGVVNLSVSSVVSLNFTNDSVNFGSGSVLSSQAIISTLGNITGGNWTAVNTRFLIINLGNNNLTINVSSGKSASTFIGGSSPSYQFNVSDFGLDKCSPPSEFNLDEFYEINATPDSRRVCDALEPLEEITIDLLLIIPNNSNTGILSDSISISYGAS